MTNRIRIYIRNQSHASIKQFQNRSSFKIFICNFHPKIRRLANSKYSKQISRLPARYIVNMLLAIKQLKLIKNICKLCVVPPLQMSDIFRWIKLLFLWYFLLCILLKAQEKDMKNNLTSSLWRSCILSQLQFIAQNTCAQFDYIWKYLNNMRAEVLLFTDLGQNGISFA